MLAYKMKLELVLEEAPSLETAEPRKIRADRNQSLAGKDKLDWNAFNKKVWKRGEAPLAMVACKVVEDSALISFISREQAIDAAEAEQVLKASLDTLGVKFSSCLVNEFQEITLTEFSSLLMVAQANDLISSYSAHLGDLGLYSLRDRYNQLAPRHIIKSGGCTMNEYITRLTMKNKKQALSHCKEIMGGASLKAELGRIYSANKYKSLGEYPVHYLIRAGSRSAALEIIYTVVSALFASKRLISTRMPYFSCIEETLGVESLLNSMLSAATHNALALEIPDKTRTMPKIRNPKDMAAFLAEIVSYYCRDTLFFLVELEDSSREFSSSLIKSLDGSVDLLLLEEGTGSAEQARNYMNYLAARAGQSAFAPEMLREVLPEGEYSPTEVEKIYIPLSRKKFRSEYYPEYDKVKFYEERNEKAKPDGIPSMAKLEKLIGLEGPKDMVRRMTAMRKVDKIRQGFNMKSEKGALHMVFTGNPGSAKTTTARLLAEILKEEGVLETGAFVECGRGDLVGKYVGWTAKIVKQKFQEAAGGVLFIDEAYALLEDHNSFGMEAINTLVQEMENHRDDVLVVLAGYPDKMKAFIDTNEGLRSRIAMYVDFPDYTVEELLEMLKLMAKERGYVLNSAILRKCRKIFSEAAEIEGFGNGRYVRNVLEAAIMNQAGRLVSNEGQAITRQSAARLRVTDFVPVKLEIGREKRASIGFSFDEGQEFLPYMSNGAKNDEL